MHLVVGKFMRSYFNGVSSSVASATPHTAAFKLGGLFDILALFSISRVNL